MLTFDEWLKEYNKKYNTNYNREDYGNNTAMRKSWQDYKYGITTNNWDGTTTTTFGDGSTATQQTPSNNENYGMPNTGGITMTINNEATSDDVVNAINEYNRKMDEYNAQERAYREYIDRLAQSNWENEFEFEKEKYKQQLKENELNRTREDSAYQRTMHDMALAGINPLMVGRFGLDPTSLGQVAGNAPATPSFHGGTPTAPQSNVSAITSDIASKRATATEQAKIELDYQRLQSDKETAWATINQGYELFKGNAELQEKLKKYDRETNELLEGLKNKGQKELQKDAQSFEKSLFDLEYELKERGQWLDFAAKIAAAGLGLVGDIFAFKKFKLPPNFGKGIPNAPEYGGGLPKPGEILPGPEGTQRSPGGIYY